jgi:two-component system cell cycle response regulator
MYLMRDKDGPAMTGNVARVVDGSVPAAVRWALLATGMVLLVDAVITIFGVGGPTGGPISIWVYNLLTLACAAICAARAADQRRERWPWLLLAFGMACQSAGNTYFTEVLVELDPPPIPSVADYLWLAFYLPAYVATVLLMRTRFPKLPRSLWLDGVIAAFAVSAVTAAIVFETVLESTAGASAEQVATLLAYPIGDLVLLALVVGGLSLSGWRPGRTLGLLTAGFLAFVITDSIYLYTVSNSAFLKLGWSVGPWLIALAAWQPSRRVRVHFDDRYMLVAPTAFGLAGLALLVFMTQVDRNWLAVALALGCMLAVMARMFLSFRQNDRLLSATRHQSLTDALTGLGNRRQLMGDLEQALGTLDDASSRMLGIFDLDGFKSYNDTFGHPAGDQLLARLAGKLRDAAGDRGRAYRLGGDEFCLLLDADLPDAERRVQAAAESLGEIGEGFAIQASYGVVSLPAEGRDVSTALHVADTRMYANKENRRSASIVAQTRDVLLRAVGEHTNGLSKHMVEVGELARNVARRLGLDAEQRDLALRTGELHDIGKLAIPASILTKSEPLTTDELEFLRRDTRVGERILSAAAALRPVARLVRSTREHFDGTGYPDRTAGEEIPLVSRIVFACDSFLQLDMPEACAEMRQRAGTEFDPDVVEALVAEVHARTRGGVRA